MKKILVIENQTQTRNLYLDCLKAQGFCTMSAENGLIGIQRAKQELPDLITSAIMLPGLDGYSVLTKLRQNPSTAIIPFIFVAAKKRKADIRRGMELGADDYLLKPCKVDELLRAITACLEKRAILEQWYNAQSQFVLQPPSERDVASETTEKLIFPHNPHLSEVFHFIKANFDQPITLGDVAQAVDYSPAYLTSLVRRQTGQTVQNWIVQYRMAVARSLLLETSESVEEIAAKVGYQNPTNFFRQFRQHHGTTPHAWRKTHRNTSACLCRGLA